MRKQILQSRTSRALARVLVAAQILSAVPAVAAEPAPAVATAAPAFIDPQAPPATTAPPPPPQVTVNRTAPKVDPVPLYAAFSAAPTAAEITKARVFGEPLFPIGGIPTPKENQALAKAIQEFQKGGDVENVTPFGVFLASHPDTPWRASVLTGLGALYRRTGYFTRAIEVLDEAWQIAKAKEGREARATSFSALSDLLEIHMQFGQVEPLERLLQELGERPLTGSVTESVDSARATVWGLRNKHEDAIPSGPVALDRIRASQGGGNARHPESLKFPPTHDGASLDQMAELSGRMGLRLTMARRQQGAKLVFPSLMHMKQGHFTAVVKEERGRYLLDDPLLGGEFWMSHSALEEESSGYFLVPEGALPSGWASASADEVKAQRGKCKWATPDYGATHPSNNQQGGPGGGGSSGGGTPPAGNTCGMATYSFHLLTANLHITDTPVSYSPPRGPFVSFQINYNHREFGQPTTFTFPNFGPKWVFDWMSYIQDNPSAPGGTVTIHYRGGGSDSYTSVTSTGSNPQIVNRSQIALVSTSPIRYERRRSDGSVEVFSQPDGALTSPRRVFLTELIDPQGHTLHFSYDGQLRLVALTDAIGQVTTLSYELSTDPLKITKVTDPYGRSAKFEYNGDGYLWRITDTVGIQSSFDYGQGDFIHALTTPYGTTHFSMPQLPTTTYASLEATDPLGGTERVVRFYGAPGIPSQDPANLVPSGFSNNTNLHFFNTLYWSKLAWSRYPGDNTKAHIMKWRQYNTYKLGDVLASEKMPLENRVWYEHSGGAYPNSVGTYGRPIRVGRVLDDGTSQITALEYNDTGRVTRSTDPVGRETLYEYDANGIDLLTTKQKNPGGPGGYDLLETRTYNSQHAQLISSDAAGQTTTYTYLPDGRLETIVTPPRDGLTQAQRTTTYAYYPENAPLGAGQIESVNGPLPGATTSYTYDAYARTRTVTDSDGYTLTYEYDLDGRPTRTTYPDGTYEETVYNRFDPEWRRDRLGRWTHTFYDALRRVTATRDPAGRTVSQVWCTCGSLEKLIDASNNATSWERDVQSRATREIRADGKDKLFVYQATTSRLKQVQDFMTPRQLTSYEYFADDNLKQVTYTNAVNPTPNVSYTYDPNYNRIATMTGGTGTTTYAYHPIQSPPNLGSGRLASLDGPLADDTVSYTYDELGRTASRGLPGFVSNHAYDALGRLTTLASPLGNFTYAYDGVTGRSLSLAYPNGQNTQHTYYPNVGEHRLQEIKHLAPGGGILSKFNYTYDVVGNIRTWAQQYESNPARVYELEYDLVDQLSAATLESTDPTPVVLKRYGYAYDPAGNRTAEQIDDAVMSASHNSRNQLTSRQPGGALLFRGTVNETANVTVAGKPALVASDNKFQGQAEVPGGTGNVAIVATDPSGNLRTNTYQVTQAGSTTSYTHDANGNLTGDGTRTFEWDAENRLLAVKQGVSALASFTYDGQGRRSTKTAGAVTTSYVYAGHQLLEERPSSGGTIRYVYGQGIDDVLAKQDGAGTFYYLKDHLGSVRQITNTSGAVVVTRDYDPWGKPLAGASEPAFSYTGREWDPETQLYYYRARYYTAGLGRFLSEDPAGSRGGLNRYSYAGGNPVVFSDPLGLCRIEVRFLPAGPLGVGNHGVILLIDPDGSVRYYRGGPATAGPSANGSSGSKSSGQGTSGASGSSGQSSGSNSGSGWGPIVTDYGAYGPGTPDWDPAWKSLPGVTVRDDGEDCCKYAKCLKDAMDGIETLHVQYNPFTRNSNTAAHAALGLCGMSCTPPVSAPGWNNPLR